MKLKHYCKNIREYVDEKDPEIREDFENHIFETVWDRFVENLPTAKDHENDRYNAIDIWFDGEEILCRTEEIAEAIANILEAISGEDGAHYHYYDPEDDAQSGETDDRTDWWYVNFD